MDITRPMKLRLCELQITAARHTQRQAEADGQAEIAADAERRIDELFTERDTLLERA